MFLMICFLSACMFSGTFAPPGTVKLKSKAIYVDKTEVTNEGWAEYVWHQGHKYGKESKEYLEAFPNAEIWQSVYKEGSIENVSSPFANHPVVGISYEQALAYCAWRTEVVEEKYKKKITYRLPSKQEWDEIAQNTLNERSFSVQKGLNKIETSKKINNLQDNVSEMTAEKGIAMGINYLDLEGNAQLGYKDAFKEHNYDKPSASLGFRCVAVME